MNTSGESKKNVENIENNMVDFFRTVPSMKFMK
jgi:hypothetical protein